MVLVHVRSSVNVGIDVALGRPEGHERDGRRAEVVDADPTAASEFLRRISCARNVNASADDMAYLNAM